MKRKILVLGGTGQIGRECVRQIPIERFSLLSPNRDDLDLRDTGAVERYIKSKKPDIVVNAAAFTAVDSAEQQREEAFILNAGLPEILAKICSAQKSKIIHFSSEYVFDGHGEKPYDEEAPTNPLNIYGESKLAGEKTIIANSDDYCILRTSWVLSASGSNFLKTILKLAGTNASISVVDDQVGCPTSAEFLGNVVLNTIERDLKGIFHVACDGYASWADVAEKIVAFASTKSNLGVKAKCTIARVKSKNFLRPAKRPLNSRMNCQKWRSTSGFLAPSWQSQVENIINEISSQRLASK